jgi:hypothetical protein
MVLGVVVANCSGDHSHACPNKARSIVACERRDQIFLARRLNPLSREAGKALMLSLVSGVRGNPGFSQEEESSDV